MKVLEVFPWPRARLESKSNEELRNSQANEENLKFDFFSLSGNLPIGENSIEVKTFKKSEPLKVPTMHSTEIIIKLMRHCAGHSASQFNRSNLR